MIGQPPTWPYQGPLTTECDQVSAIRAMPGSGWDLPFLARRTVSARLSVGTRRQALTAALRSARVCGT